MGCSRGGPGGTIAAGADQVLWEGWGGGGLVHVKRVARIRPFVENMQRKPFVTDILVGLDQLGVADALVEVFGFGINQH